MPKRQHGNNNEYTYPLGPFTMTSDTFVASTFTLAGAIKLYQGDLLGALDYLFSAVCISLANKNKNSVVALEVAGTILKTCSSPSIKMFGMFSRMMGSLGAAVDVYVETHPAKRKKRHRY